MWRNGNPFALLVGMQIGAATVKAVWRYFNKWKMDLFVGPVISLLRLYLKEPKTLIWKNISTAMFTVALFTITKVWKQATCPSVDEWLKQLWGLHNGILISSKKEESFTLCNCMDEPGENCAKWNKSIRERQLTYEFTHMWNLMNWPNKESGDRLIDGEQDDSQWGAVRVWRDWAKRKRDSWTWTTLWWLLGKGDIRGLYGNGKITIQIKWKNKM